MAPGSMISQSSLDWLDQAIDLYDGSALDLVADPLVLSVAAYRQCRLTNFAVRWPDLNSVAWTEEDVTTANEMVRYYRDRLTINVLKGHGLTNFQATLQQLITSKQYENRHVGMIYRLPYFYAEDRARDELCANFAHHTLPHDQPIIEVRQLTPCRSILRSRKRGESKEFWFADDRGFPVCWSVAFDNSLLSMVDDLWENSSLRVQARYRPSHMGWINDWWFYQLEKPALR